MKVEHIFRERNMLADYLAKRGGGMNWEFIDQRFLIVELKIDFYTILLVQPKCILSLRKHLSYREEVNRYHFALSPCPIKLDVSCAINLNQFDSCWITRGSSVGIYLPLCEGKVLRHRILCINHVIYILQCNLVNLMNFIHVRRLLLFPINY